ncbi:MAG: beta-lactamase family protein [Ruminococcus sp.]|nr:beta-lactamase family protein [Ruminococcus sp.]
MNVLKRIVCAVLAAATLVLCFASCEEKKELDVANITLTQKQLKDVQTKIEKALTDADFSGGVYVKLNKNTLYENYFGIEDPVTDKKISASTQYQVSSMTKNITGAAILQLCDEGKLKLDDTLDLYFDATGDKAYLKKITVKQLVGVEVSFGAYFLNLLSDNKKIDQVERLIKKGKGLKSYITDYILTNGIESGSNQPHSNYYLLGIIIEKASGMDYKEYIRKNIFDKLKMTKSTFVDKNQPMRGYNVDTEMWRDEKLNIFYNDYDFMFSSFGVVSDVGDMLKFYDATLAGKITKTNMIKKINEFYTNYGFGFRHDGHNLYGYSGTSLHTSFVYLNDETKEIVILNSNQIGNIRLNATGKAVYNAVNSKINGMRLSEE